MSVMHADAGGNAVDLAEKPEDAAEDEADHVLDRCEAIAGSLRQLLGQHQAAQGCVSTPSILCSEDSALSPTEWFSWACIWTSYQGLSPVWIRKDLA